jgi:hypothetical protein
MDQTIQKYHQNISSSKGNALYDLISIIFIRIWFSTNSNSKTLFVLVFFFFF